MIPAPETLDQLRAGNRRFIDGELTDRGGESVTRREQLAGKQEPPAIILGCSDSRVPAEMVFDQGLGDLFVVRVAGNIATPTQVGSIEFAAEQFGSRLVVVLGHSQCGAIKATLSELSQPNGGGSPNVGSLVEGIRPALEPLVAGGDPEDPEALLTDAVRANVRASAEHLRNDSDVLARLIRDDGLVVVGAEYSLDTGAVDFFDGVPSTE